MKHKLTLFTKRSNEKELIDLGPAYYTHDEYIDCLKKLFRINKLLGFFRDTAKTLKQFSNASTLLDIGCGGGLFILHLSKLFPKMPMIGTDISSAAITDAQQSLREWQKINPNMNVSFVLQKQSALNAAMNSIDIILVTLVCHHLSDDELILFLQQTYHTAKKAIIINDLHRHYLSYWFYRLMSPLLFRNRLISHDGLISIRRGFTRQEWHLLLQKAGIHQYTLKWCFPFRWMLIMSK